MYDALSKVLIAVPFHRNIEWETEEALLRLEKQGCMVWRRYDAADLAYVRSEMCSRFLTEKEFAQFTHLLFVDSDVIVDAGMIEKLFNTGMEVIGGFCPTRDGSKIGAVLRKGDAWPVWGTEQVVWLSRIGMYCTLISRHVLRAVEKMHDFHLLRDKPFFGTMVCYDQMLSEDYSFCERVKRSGHKVCGHANVLPGHLAKIPMRLGIKVGLTLGSEPVRRVDGSDESGY